MVDPNLPVDQRYKVDNILIGTWDLDKIPSCPQVVGFDGSGDIIMRQGQSGQAAPKWCKCKLCGSIRHDQEDCYIQEVIDRNDLDTYPSGLAKACTLCHEYEHPVRRCPILKYQDRCMNCSEEHETRACPNRRPTDRRNLMSQGSECTNCTEHGPGARPCLHLPKGVIPAVGRAWIGRRCQRCKIDCVCYVEEKAINYCRRCGRCIQGMVEEHECEQQLRCTSCGSSQHPSLDCKYFVLKNTRDEKPCDVCGAVGHDPVNCAMNIPPMEETCLVCFEKGHEYWECHT